MYTTDTELISELKKHNPGAFESLIYQYTKPVGWLVQNILHPSGTKEDMEECVSDVFVEVWQKIDQFDSGRGNFKTWVFMLAKYKALAYRRALSGSTVDNIDDYQLEDSATVEQQVLSQETQQTILETLHTFSALDKELFLRRYYLGESIKDLMNAYNLTRSAVDNRLLRCRKTIKEALSREGTGSQATDAKLG